MRGIGQKKLAFTSKVMEIFTDVQKNPSIQKTQILQLVKFAQEDAELFMYSFEQSYLKIFHSFHSKNNKKIPTKFENLAQSVFEAMLPKAHDSGHDGEKIMEVFNSFLLLCTEGIYSTVMNIRIMCARLTFMLVKLIPPRKMDLYLNEEVQAGIMNSTLHLLRTKVSTYRQLGIKLASLIMHINSEGSESIEKEMLKILSVEDNEQIRKLVITNLAITPGNLGELLVRLRDKNPQIRAIVAKKLQGERFRLEDMTVNNLYKLLYDGYGSKEVLVKKECLRYFAMYFVPDPQIMDEEDRNRPREFVQMFRPQILLLNPHLYHLFNELIGELLEEVEQYLRRYIQESCHKLKRGNITHEIIWMKNSVNSQARQIAKIYEQFGPTGVDLAKLLLNLSQRNQIFAMFELLQLFAAQKMPDEIGRNKMFDSLKELLSTLSYSEVSPDYSNFKDTDICHVPTPEEVTRKKLMLSYYDMPIISTSFDLIYQIGETMKNLRPQHYEIEMKEIMAQWHSPDENTLHKEKELLQKNIKQLEAKGDKRLMTNMVGKLENINDRISQQHEKTRKVLMCISRLRYNCDLEVFMSIIKDELTKQDKANGLLLLGLYCLENNDKVTSFWSVFWNNIINPNIEQKNKNHLLVSLKVVVDFMVKFNCLSNNFEPEAVEDFSADLFMDHMVRLMLDRDAEIRILAIESLCRLLYHERVDKDNEPTYFLLLILLWLQTSTEDVSAKSVHTVSIFIKSYMEKGNAYSLKLAETFCQFFMVIVKLYEQKKGINKSLIVYNLTMQQFLKKTIFTVMTIFKYQKESKNVIWTYNPQQNQLGPQEFILLFLLKNDKIVPFLGKTLMLCDFFQFCGLETLILVKKVIEELNETRRWKGQVEQSIKKLQSDIQIQISLKNSQIFNDHTVENMENDFSEKMKLLAETSRYLHRNIEDKNLFVKLDLDDSDSDESPESSSSSEQSEEEQVSSMPRSLGEASQSIKKKINNEEENEAEQEEQVDESSSESKMKNAPRRAQKKKKEPMPPAPIRNLRTRKR